MWGVLVLGVFAAIFVVGWMRAGHVQAGTDMVIAAVLILLGSAAAILEILRWVPCGPVNLINRRRLRRAKVEVRTLLLQGFLMPVETDVYIAWQVRRLVIFDGVCVLCNKFGRTAFYRLVNPDLVSFVPFQDAQHVIFACSCLAEF
jgi:hypothetical protein